MEVIRTLIHKTLVREGDPDQTASLEAVWSGSALNFKLFGQATSTPKNYVHWDANLAPLWRQKLKKLLFTNFFQLFVRRMPQV